MKPLVAVSRCLLGEAVRYDGLTKANKWIIDNLSQLVDFYPVCPEVEAGLLVPRPPVQLVRVENDLLALGVTDKSLDVTKPLQQFSSSQQNPMQQISGYIFKSKSPSCGIDDVPIFNMSGELVEKGAGLHAAWLQKNFPEMPLIDEKELENIEKRTFFIDQVFANYPLF